jgi:hypothetical protein
LGQPEARNGGASQRRYDQLYIKSFDIESPPSGADSSKLIRVRKKPFGGSHELFAVSGRSQSDPAAFRPELLGQFARSRQDRDTVSDSGHRTSSSGGHSVRVGLEQKIARSQMSREIAEAKHAGTEDAALQLPMRSGHLLAKALASPSHQEQNPVGAIR